MLLFAVGIAVVALLFYDFISRLDLGQQAQNIVLANAKIVSDQLNNELLCSDKFTVIPDRLLLGAQQEPFFYDLEFAQQSIGDSDAGKNLLIVRIVEHKMNTGAKKNIIASKSIVSDTDFILIAPDFLKEGSPLDASYNDGKNVSIALNPRAASKSTSTLNVAPNAFVALKEVIGGRKKMYIIPCSTEKEPNNCTRNILRVGCYLLQKGDTGSGALTANSPVRSCFNVSTSVSSQIESTMNYKWSDCTTVFSSTLTN
jgi:hypothetical protein